MAEDVRMVIAKEKQEKHDPDSEGGESGEGSVKS